MLSYIIRRVLYAIPILIGVNIITFLLFFFVNTPDQIALSQLGDKRTTEAAIQQWKADRGYDKPNFWNSDANGVEKFTETIFFDMLRKTLDVQVELRHGSREIYC